MIQLEAIDLSKSFGTRRIFENVSFSTGIGESLAITGPNGSGKSTMIHILTGLGRASSGTVQYSGDRGKLAFEQYHDRMSVVTPYHELYDALTAFENIVFYTRMSGREVSREDMDEAVKSVGLTGRGNDAVGSYSSGMKQRLKYALARLRQPEILLLDEPTAYLDASGKELILEYLKSLKNSALMVIATNEREEADFADRVCQLGG